MTRTHTSILALALLWTPGCMEQRIIDHGNDTGDGDITVHVETEPLDVDPFGHNHTGGRTDGYDPNSCDEPIDTGSAEPCPEPAYVKPGALNTGPYDESVLRDSSSVTVSEDGAVIEDLYVRGMIKVKANDVTLRNLIVDCEDASLYGIQTQSDYSDAVIEHVEIKNCKSAGIDGPNFHASNVEIHEMWGNAVNAYDNVTLQFSWIHHLGKTESSYNNGIQTGKGSNILLLANFFDMPIGALDSGSGESYQSDATSFSSTKLGDIDNFVMEGNWLNGGNYTVYFSGSEDGADDDFWLSNSALIGNRFGRDYRWGAFKAIGNIENLDVSCNRWDDTSELMDINDAD